MGNQDYSKGAPYSDGYSNTLGDIAMKYYTENLRPTLSTGDVPVADGCSDPSPDARLDCNANLHMNTYTVGLGALGYNFWRNPSIGGRRLCQFTSPGQM